MTFSIPFRPALLIAALLLSAAAPAADCRADQGSATLTSSNGQLILQLDLPTPTPTNLIAELKLQSRAQVVATEPEAAKIDKKRSTVKWLVKNPRQNRLRLTVKTTPPVEPQAASAVVTFRNPSDGTLVQIQAR